MRRAFFFCVMMAAAMAAFAQSGQVPFRLSVDVSRFRGPDDTTATVEVCYALPQAALTFGKDSAGLSASLDLTLRALTKDSVIYVDRWLVESVVSDTAQMNQTRNLVGLRRFALRSGSYTLRIVGRDTRNAAHRDSLDIRLAVKPFPVTALAFSDLEIASVIRTNGQPSPFLKNTLEVIPNVGAVFSGDQTCYYYVEAYNLLVGGDARDFIVRTTVRDAVGKEVYTHDRVRKRQGESLVVADQMSLKAVHSGTYQMQVTAVDSSNKVLAAASKKFFVYNPGLGIDTTLVTGNANVPLAVLSSMDEEDLDEEFRMARYEAQDFETKQFKQLQGADAKRQFISAFWRRRPVGFRDTYMQRVDYVNMNFGMANRKGYKTDRGRVYVVYGVPDEVERHPNESDAKPYEIWSYHSIQGGVIFVFAQRNPSGDYELLHSTHRNEMQDTNWGRYVFTNQSTTGSSSSSY